MERSLVTRRQLLASLTAGAVAGPAVSTFRVPVWAGASGGAVVASLTDDWVSGESPARFGQWQIQSNGPPLGHSADWETRTADTVNAYTRGECCVNRFYLPMMGRLEAKAPVSDYDADVGQIVAHPANASEDNYAIQALWTSPISGPATVTATMWQALADSSQQSWRTRYQLLVDFSPQRTGVYTRLSNPRLNPVVEVLPVTLSVGTQILLDLRRDGASPATMSGIDITVTA